MTAMSTTATATMASTSRATMGPACRVFVVDDHWFVRDAIARMLDARSEMVLVGAAASLAEALARVDEADPDVALLDLGLPDGTGIELAAELRRRAPLLRCVIFSAHDTAAIDGWARHGAVHDVVGKGAEPEALCRRLLRAWRSPVDLRPAPVWRPLDQLSEREHQVFFELGRGRTTKEIAADFGLSTSTIDKYKQAIRDKFALPDHDKLLRLAALVWQPRSQDAAARAEERSLVAAFESRLLPPERWTHRAWLRVAFHTLSARGPIEAAQVLIQGTARLARTHGRRPPPAAAVHGAVAALHARLTADPVHLSASTFLAAHPDLLGSDPHRAAFAGCDPARAGDMDRAPVVEPDGVSSSGVTPVTPMSPSAQGEILL